jgi:hypothetical protein
MALIAQPEQEISPEDRENSASDYVVHVARFYKHLQQASAILDRQMRRGTPPPHIRRCFCLIQDGLLLAAESVRHATQRSARHG